MRIQLFYLLLGGLVLLLTACSTLIAATPNPTSRSLTVFAAASLIDPFTEFEEMFEAAHPSVDVILNFAGSQALRLQIEQGAPADVFVSANQNHAQALVAAHLIEVPVIFAKNQLVVIVPADNPASINTLADLARPEQKLILADPNVPVGNYAREVLENLNADPALGPDFSVWVLDNLVSEEDNVKGVVAKVLLGEADAGIVYTSDVTPAIAAELRTITIPAAYNVEAVYPLAITSNSKSPDLAQQFVEFVLSPQGQTVLADHAFQPIHLQFAGQKP